MAKAKGIVQGSFGRVALLDVDRPVVAHAHPHCHVLFKVSGADSFFQVRDRLYPLSDNTAVVVNSWELHSYPHSTSTPRSLVLALYVAPDWLSDIERNFAVCCHPKFFARACVEVPRDVRRFVDLLAHALLWDEGQAKDREELLFNLMVSVIDNFSDWRKLRSSWQASSFRVRDFRIRRAIDFMRDNVGKSPGADAVARAAGLSRAHLFELFKQNTGLTPNLYYNVLRMEAAYAALPMARQPMARIATRLGFSAPGHFSRFFRNNLGVSPSAYRRTVLYERPANSDASTQA